MTKKDSLLEILARLYDLQMMVGDMAQKLDEEIKSLEKIIGEDGNTTEIRIHNEIAEEAAEEKSATENKSASIDMWVRLMEISYNIVQPEGMDFCIGTNPVDGIVKTIYNAMDAGEEMPQSGIPISTVMQSIKHFTLKYGGRTGEGRKWNNDKWTMAASAILLILLEQLGFKFAQEVDSYVCEQKWYRTLIQYKEIYQNNVIYYPQEKEFDWKNALGQQFSVDFRECDSKDYFSMNNAKRYIESIERRDIVLYDGQPMNKVLRAINWENTLYSALCIILLKKAGYHFGDMPDGIADMQSAWFIAVKEHIERYEDRIIIY